jgi:dimethylargininase
MGGRRGVALVRPVSPRLAEGIVTHLERTPVDVELARRQHAGYVAALARHGWEPRVVEPADGCPDSVFVEDAVVVCAGTAVLTRPGAAQRRPELAGVEAAVRALGLPLARIEAPGTLDGGDVLQVDRTVYVGQSGRTDAEGTRQLAALLAPLGREVVPVPLRGALHLKSAVTALPDGTLVTWAGARHVDKTGWEVPEEGGAHLVPLGEGEVLLAASAPRTAELLADRGLSPIVVDISEFERLEGCVTCLSVLIPD